MGRRIRVVFYGGIAMTQTALLYTVENHITAFTINREANRNSINR